MSTFELPFVGSDTWTVCNFEIPKILVSTLTSIAVGLPAVAFAGAPSNNTMLAGVKFLPVNWSIPWGTPTITLEGDTWKRTGVDPLEFAVTVRVSGAPWLRFPDMPVTVTFSCDAAEPAAAVKVTCKDEPGFTCGVDGEYVTPVGSPEI